MQYGDEATTQILRLLTVEPRASNKRIAECSGLSEVAVAARIKALQADNVMRVVLQQDTSESSPNSIAAIVEFYLERPEFIVQVATALAGFDEIFSVYETARRPEIIINCRAEGQRALNALLMRLAQTIPNVREMHSLPILSLGRYSTVLGTLRRYPGDAGGPRPSDPLTSLLQRDGRQSISSLARQLGLSITATRYRLNKLLREPGVRIGLICDSEALGYSTWCEVRASITPALLESALERFSGRENVRVVAHLAGASNLALFLLCRSIEELDRFVAEEIRLLPGLLDFTLMRVPRVFKFDYNYNL